MRYRHLAARTLIGFFVIDGESLSQHQKINELGQFPMFIGVVCRQSLSDKQKRMDLDYKKVYILRFFSLTYNMLLFRIRFQFVYCLQKLPIIAG
jgi:hypothetical protein